MGQLLPEEFPFPPRKSTVRPIPAHRLTVGPGRPQNFAIPARRLTVGDDPPQYSLVEDFPAGQLPAGQLPAGQLPGVQLPGGQLPGVQLPAGRLPAGTSSRRIVSCHALIRGSWNLGYSRAYD